jgi:hypothetical protein
VGEISTTITEKTGCRMNARCHKIKNGFLRVSIDNSRTAELKRGGRRRSRKLWNIKRILLNFDGKKKSAGVCWVGVGEMLSSLPPKTACRRRAKIREIEFPM